MSEETKKGTKGSLTWLWIAIVVIILAAVWFIFVRSGDSDTGTTDTSTPVSTAPKHDDWQKYTSAKYGFTLYHPTDYILEEGPTSTIKLKKGATEMVDMYVYAANGDEEGMMRSQEALFTDDSKDYMIADEAIQTKVAGATAKTVNGKFSKNAGLSQTHEGTTGTTVFFARDDKLFIFDSYDNGDAAAKEVFTDILADLSF